MSSFDLAIIGAGPGGFDAALRARELGFSVALIEKAELGGTCLNTGCIPTKSLLASTRFLTQLTHGESYGLPPATPTWDLSSLLARKDRIVQGLRKGMWDSIKRTGVEWLLGKASFAGKNRLIVKDHIFSSPQPSPQRGEGRVRGESEIEAKFILIAAGSEPIPFPHVPFDGQKIFSSTGLLESRILPKSLLILGGGVVGVEFASIFRPLGVKIVIVEMLDRLIATEDEEISRRLESVFSRQGVEIHTGSRVKGLDIKGGKVEAHLESGKKLEADQVLVALGRRPHLKGLELEKAGIKTEKGAIVVNEYLETTAPGIFAIGDVTNRSTGLAHGASAEGVQVVENLKGQKMKMDYDAIPNCIYTDPEVASVGTGRPTTEETVECKMLFSSLGKSQIEGETEGFIKMTASKKEGRILRVAGIGSHVTELIHEATLAVKAGLSVQVLAKTIHAHPTQSEIFQKAAQLLRHKMN